jgi:c-di-GMP-related signal transduction protein
VEVFLARQPIFDRQRQVYGYELLFRSGDVQDKFDGTEASSATMQVMANALLAGDLHALSGKKAFLNFDHSLLRDGLHLAMPPQSIVIELLETVDPTEELLDQCRNLRQQGYTIALDDFVPDPRFEPLTRIAQLIKVDFRTTGKQEQQRVLREYGSRGVKMLAEKVETYEEFEWASNAGYDLFQGYFFAHPVLVRGRQIPTVKIACLRLLREVAQADMDFERLEDLVGEDVSLSYKLLRYANSPLFGRRSQTHSIPTALVILGEVNLRHWAALAALPMMAQDKPGELVTLALVRAKFCERLAQLAGLPLANEAFLMGMFSLLGALIDKPLGEALHEVNLDPRITTALLGTSSEHDVLAGIHRLTLCYEAGDWDDVEALARTCHIQVPAVGNAYVEAAKWADCAMRGFN